MSFILDKVSSPLWTDSIGERINEQVETCNTAVEKFEKVFLKDKKFIIGKEISFADLLAVNEVK